MGTVFEDAFHGLLTMDRIVHEVHADWEQTSAHVVDNRTGLDHSIEICTCWLISFPKIKKKKKKKNAIVHIHIIKLNNTFWDDFGVFQST